MTLKDFEILKSLGSGSFASVYKVKRISDGKEYAMKKVRMNQLKQKEKENAVNEVRILASINDPNVIAYKEAFYDENSNSLCIVMEYADGGDLLSKINEAKKRGHIFDEEIIWKYFIQMLKGLKKLHSMKILHRDLKCANIFLTLDHMIKIGDLNVSKIAKAGLVYTRTGTPYYASPEVWKDQPYDGKSDIWSLGCVLYELIMLKPPFRAFDMEGLCKKVTKGVYDRLPSRYSRDLSNIISACLTVNPSNRPNCEQLLNNPIIQKRLSQNDSSPTKPKISIHSDLLSTIKMPRNLRALQEKLPKPKYNTDIHISFDCYEESKAESESLEQIHYSIDGYSKAPLVRAITSGNQLRIKSNSSSNKENRVSLDIQRQRGSSIEDPKPQDKTLMANHSQALSKDIKLVCPIKKPGIPLPPTSGTKPRNDLHFRKTANRILSENSIIAHSVEYSQKDGSLLNDPNANEFPPTPLIIPKSNRYGSAIDENKSIFQQDKKSNFLSKIIYTEVALTNSVDENSIKVLR